MHELHADHGMKVRELSPKGTALNGGDKARRGGWERNEERNGRRLVFLGQCSFHSRGSYLNFKAAQF